MATKKKLLQAAAGAAAASGGAAGLNVEDVFSTYLYEATGTTNIDIVNNIDLSGEGGLVWLKARTEGADHYLIDTERGANKYIRTNKVSSEGTASNTLNSFNSDGFQVGTNNTVNNTGDDYASWTFRKAPKFFDCIKYSGNSTAGRTISHNLGCDVGVLIIKDLTTSLNQWQVWHRSLGASHYLLLDGTDAATTSSTRMTNGTAPTSTEFTIGSHDSVNQSGRDYIAYLFAHNDGDGDFGPTGDQDIIKCGSYTGGSNVIDLGFEPQLVIFKRTDSSTGGDWYMYDAMRGFTSNSGTSGDSNYIFANRSNAEALGGNRIQLKSYGFDSTANLYSSGTYIYIAIRRGPMAVPTDATEVFDVADRVGASGNQGAYRSGFPVDMAFHKVVTSSINTYEIGSRLTQGKSMNTPDTSAEVSQSDQQYDYMDGWNSETSASSSKYSWMWRRAPSYFDVVAYSGNGTAGRTVSHNLGVAPEMMWVKARNASQAWAVYHSGMGNTKYMRLSDNTGEITSSTRWNDTSPTDSVFTVGTDSNVNNASYNYIAYLFASVDGVSKVGSYTGNGSTQNIDCGFSSGARFVLIKVASRTGNWHVFDTERGIIAGDDPRLELDTTDAGDTDDDYLDPYSSGFTVNYDDTFTTSINSSGHTYIFYAIA